MKSHLVKRNITDTRGLPIEDVNDPDRVIVDIETRKAANEIETMKRNRKNADIHEKKVNQEKDPSRVIANVHVPEIVIIDAVDRDLLVTSITIHIADATRVIVIRQDVMIPDHHP